MVLKLFEVGGFLSLSIFNLEPILDKSMSHELNYENLFFSAERRCRVEHSRRCLELARKSKERQTEK